MLEREIRQKASHIFKKWYLFLLFATIIVVVAILSADIYRPLIGSDSVTRDNQGNFNEDLINESFIRDSNQKKVLLENGTNHSLLQNQSDITNLPAEKPLQVKDLTYVYKSKQKIAEFLQQSEPVILGSSPLWPISTQWIFFDNDPNEGGAQDDNRDVNNTYYYFDENYLYLRMCMYGIPVWQDNKGKPVNARYKWFIDLDHNSYISGGNIVEGDTIQWSEAFLGKYRKSYWAVPLTGPGWMGWNNGRRRPKSTSRDWSRRLMH